MYTSFADSSPHTCTAQSGHLAGMAINQWWERWAWRTPRTSPCFFSDTWGWAPPSSLPFNELPNIIMSPNACEKSTEYWEGCAAFVAEKLQEAAAGTLTCGVTHP